ncbi:TadE/TadG family type IV pilus assembly protein [Streptomonospora nanhaiensis]|uniref:TadE/TadG family type IV pilus assembly protein n=1 Tax=Streptomonospora nanhaiensis TaxID=1323731 RepID=UPI001C99972D|nr:TadE/TadG family type IV pilus assembly protein [Streptomonospora nanhaiensis]MBX9390555.1 pilus assembly protein [Streptomonospora nanhaiensis]
MARSTPRSGPPVAHRTRPRADDDRGSAEVAVATPLLLLLVLLVVQVAVWMHGDHTAASVARHAVETARAADSAGAQAQAEAFADEIGGSVLGNRVIVVERGEVSVRVVVEAEVPSLIPGLTWPVRHELTAPVERFVEPGEAGGAAP